VHVNTYEAAYAKYMRHLPRREANRERSARYYREVTKPKRAAEKLFALDGWLRATCEKCQQPILERDFARAVMVSVPTGYGYLRTTGPFHEECTK
jgi:ribosomal protein L44E